MFGEDEDDDFETNSFAENLNALKLEHISLAQPNNQSYPIEILKEDEVLRTINTNGNTIDPSDV